MTEKQLQQTIVDLCRWLRLRVYHTYDSRRSEPGWPDLVIVGNSVLYAELKSDRGRVSREQQEWHDILTAAGAEVHVWRPRHLQDIRRRLHQLAGRAPGGRA